MQMVGTAINPMHAQGSPLDDHHILVLDAEEGGGRVVESGGPLRAGRLRVPNRGDGQQPARVQPSQAANAGGELQRGDVQARESRASREKPALRAAARPRAGPRGTSPRATSHRAAGTR